MLQPFEQEKEEKRQTEKTQWESSCHVYNIPEVTKGQK